MCCSGRHRSKLDTGSVWRTSTANCRVFRTSPRIRDQAGQALLRPPNLRIWYMGYRGIPWKIDWFRGQGPVCVLRRRVRRCRARGCRGQVEERLQPGLLLAIDVLDLGPVVGTADDGQRREKENGFQGMVLSPGSMFPISPDQQGNQGNGDGGHGRCARQGQDGPSCPQTSLVQLACDCPNGVASARTGPIDRDVHSMPILVWCHEAGAAMVSVRSVRMTNRINFKPRSLTPQLKFGARRSGLQAGTW